MSEYYYDQPCHPWYNRFFLVISNAAAFVPMAYLLKRVRPIPWDGVCFILLAFIASCMFHSCDNTGNECDAVCIASDALLLASDTILVNELVAVAYLFAVPRNHADFKAVFYVVFLIVNALLYYYYSEPEDYQMIIWAVAMLGVVIVFHVAFRCMNSPAGDVRHLVTHHIGITASVLFAIFALGGFAMRWIGNDEVGLYTPLHSSFHVAGFLSLYFFFRIFDVGGLWTWETMRCGYDVAATDDIEMECDDVGVLTGAL